MKKVLVLGLFALAAALVGCNVPRGSGSPAAAAGDSIEVKRLRSASKKDSPYFIVTATVAYTLASEAEAKIIFGLDGEVPGRIAMLDMKPIGRGSGTVELVAEIERKADRRILEAVFAMDHKTPGGVPLAYQRSSLEYPQVKKEPGSASAP